MIRQPEKPERLAIVVEAMRYKMARTLSVEPSDRDPKGDLPHTGSIR